MEDDKLVNFDRVPLGAKIKYPESDKIWVVLSKHRVHNNTEPMSGILAEYTNKLDTRQSIVSHIAGDADCPEMVVFVE